MDLLVIAYGAIIVFVLMSVTRSYRDAFRERSRRKRTRS